MSSNDSDLAEPIRITRDVLAQRVEGLAPCGDGRTSAELAGVATDWLTDVHGTFRKPATW